MNIYKIFKGVWEPTWQHMIQSCIVYACNNDILVNRVFSQWYLPTWLPLWSVPVSVLDAYKFVSDVLWYMWKYTQILCLFLKNSITLQWKDTLKQVSTKFLVKGHTVNIFSFSDHKVYVATIHLCWYSLKAAIDNI